MSPDPTCMDSRLLRSFLHMLCSTSTPPPPLTILKIFRPFFYASLTGLSNASGEKLTIAVAYVIFTLLFSTLLRLGLDPKLLASVLNTSSGRCWSSEIYNPVPGVVQGVPSGNDYKGGFGTALMMKVGGIYCKSIDRFYELFKRELLLG